MNRIAHVIAIMIVATVAAWLLCGMCIIRRYSPAQSSGGGTATKEIVWLKLDETSGRTLTNSGTLGGTFSMQADYDSAAQLTADGKIGKCFQFSYWSPFYGTRVDMGRTFETEMLGSGKPFTISYWTKWNSYQTSVVLCNEDGNGYAPFISFSSVYTDFQTDQGVSSSGTYRGTPAASNGTWVLLTWTRTADGLLTQYRNATEWWNSDSEYMWGTGGSMTDGVTNLFLFGKPWYNAEFASREAFDDIRFFSQALSAEEVSWLYNSGSGRSDPLP